jgi:hypothetical protein
LPDCRDGTDVNVPFPQTIRKLELLQRERYARHDGFAIKSSARLPPRSCQSGKSKPECGDGRHGSWPKASKDWHATRRARAATVKNVVGLALSAVICSAIGNGAMRCINTIERQVFSGNDSRVVDNYATQGANPRRTVHFTPTSASWPNASKVFFCKARGFTLRRSPPPPLVLRQRH